MSVCGKYAVHRWTRASSPKDKVCVRCGLPFSDRGEAFLESPPEQATCSDWEDLNTKFRIATLRYGRFMDSLKGLDQTDRDEEEATRLEDEMNEAKRALLKHQEEHRCRG